MNFKAVLFDLDGTLLPMDQDVFTKSYFGAIAKWLAPHGFEPTALVDSIMKGSVAMVKNDGTKTNEAVFWDCFEGRMGKVDKELFDSFYRLEAIKLMALCGEDARAARVVEWVREAGGIAVLATNPMFPAIFTHMRAEKAGLVPEEFALVTTYENSSHCKPNPEYYRDILAALNLAPEDCLMVGNDVEEDMIPAVSLGMKVFLLTDRLINKKNRDISAFPNGDFDSLLHFLKQA